VVFKSELGDRRECIDWTAIGRTGDRWFYRQLLDDFPSLFGLYDPTQFDAVSIEPKMTSEGGKQRPSVPDYGRISGGSTPRTGPYTRTGMLKYRDDVTGD
jgi:hypothetical protein